MTVTTIQSPSSVSVCLSTMTEQLWVTKDTYPKATVEGEDNVSQSGAAN